MKHFEITFSELISILSEARMSLKEEMRIYQNIWDNTEKEKNRQLITLIRELSKYITESPSDYFKIIEDNPF